MRITAFGNVPDDQNENNGHVNRGNRDFEQAMAPSSEDFLGLTRALGFKAAHVQGGQSQGEGR